MNSRRVRLRKPLVAKGNGGTLTPAWIAVAFIAAIGYFFATQFGFALRFQPYPVPVMWPANAVVMSVLLLTPRRVWPIVLLFVLPAHLAAGANHQVPWPMLFSWYLSNSFECVLGAALTRLLLQEKIRFDRLRHVLVFYLFGALFSILIASFIDSAFVQLNTLHGVRYWEVWASRFFSYFFASLTIVPVIVTWSVAFSTAHKFSHLMEATLLAVGLAGTSFLSFYGFTGGVETVPARLSLLLPFFIWAALRFGVRGVSTAILGMAIFAIWTSIHSHGPFTGGTPQENALSIQTFFTLLSVILVPMAAIFTEKKEVSEALQASEQRYRMIVESQTDLVGRCLPDTTLTFVNDAWCRFFDLPREKLIGKQMIDFICPGSQERILSYFATTILHRKATLWECDGHCFGRNDCCQQWVIHPIIDENGHIREVQAVARDITQLKHAEEALRESAERYRGVVEAQPDLVCRYLPDSTLIFANQAFCSFFGRSREELIGRKVTELLPPEARGKILESVEARPTNQQPFVWENALQSADGNLQWHQWASYAITNTDGHMTVIQTVGRDITSRKQAEEATRKLAHVSRLATIGELTAIIVHEVSQPLNAILTNIASGEMLLRQKPLPIDELLAVLSDIRHDNYRAVEAVRRVRTFSKQNQMEKLPVRLDTLIEDVLRLLHGEILRRHVTVDAQVDEDLPPVLGDQLGLEHVVLNLVVNALDSVGDVPQSERLIWVDAAHKNDQIIVSVKDNGGGIPNELFGRVFESFFTTKREGLGLGLSISRSIIQGHGGYLWAENNKDRGATFCFSLPATEPVERSSQAPLDSAPAAS